MQSCHVYNPFCNLCSRSCSVGLISWKLGFSILLVQLLTAYVKISVFHCSTLKCKDAFVCLQELVLIPWALQWCDDNINDSSCWLWLYMCGFFINDVNISVNIVKKTWWGPTWNNIELNWIGLVKSDGRRICLTTSQCIDPVHTRRWFIFPFSYLLCIKDSFIDWDV